MPGSDQGKDGQNLDFTVYRVAFHNSIPIPLQQKFVGAGIEKYFALVSF